MRDVREGVSLFLCAKPLQGNRIADVSVKHVERRVLPCGWTVERTTNDYGIDLYIRPTTPMARSRTAGSDFS